MCILAEIKNLEMHKSTSCINVGFPILCRYQRALTPGLPFNFACGGPVCQCGCVHGDARHAVSVTMPGASTRVVRLLLAHSKIILSLLANYLSYVLDPILFTKQ